MQDLDKPLSATNTGDKNNTQDRQVRENRRRSRRGGRNKNNRRRGERSRNPKDSQSHKITHQQHSYPKRDRRKHSQSRSSSRDSRSATRKRGQHRRGDHHHRDHRSQTEVNGNDDRRNRHESPSRTSSRANRRIERNKSRSPYRSSRNESDRKNSRKKNYHTDRNGRKSHRDSRSRSRSTSRHERERNRYQREKLADQPRRDLSRYEVEQRRKRERERDERRRTALTVTHPSSDSRRARRMSNSRERHNQHTGNISRQHRQPKEESNRASDYQSLNTRLREPGELPSDRESGVVEPQIPQLGTPPEQKTQVNPQTSVVERSTREKSHSSSGSQSDEQNYEKFSKSSETASLNRGRESSQNSDLSSSSSYSSSSCSSSQESFCSKSQHQKMLTDELINGTKQNSNLSASQFLSAPGVVHPNLEHPQNYEESIRKLEHTDAAIKEKEILKKYSLEKGAIIDVRLFVGQVPKAWTDSDVNEYFSKLGQVLEARIIRDKFGGSHRGCAFIRCKMFHDAELILDCHRPRAKKVAEDEGLMPRLQLRYADGELERLGIVNIDMIEQTKLYVTHLDKTLDQEVILQIFSQFGEVEELFCFKDQFETFRGCIFIKYKIRKQALKAIQFLSMKGMADNRYAAQLVEKVPVNQQIDIRFADKKRKEGVGQPQSFLPPSSLQQPQQTTVIMQQQFGMMGQVGMTWPAQPNLQMRQIVVPIQPQQQPLQYVQNQQFTTPGKHFSIPVVPSPTQTAMPQHQFTSFFRSLLQNPSKQHLYLRYINEGTPYFLDTVTMQSQWQEPPSQTLQGLDVVILNGQAVNAQLTNYLQQKEQALTCIQTGQYKQGPPGANLFIFHLPNEWSDLDLFNFFSEQNCGVILSVRIMTDKTSGRSKGYGFVSYETSENAKLAILSINGKQALGKRLKVELKKGGISQAMNFEQENFGVEMGSDTDSVVQQILGKDDSNNQSMTNMIYEGVTGISNTSISN